MSEMKRLSDDSSAPRLARALDAMRKDAPPGAELRRREIVAAMLAVPPVADVPVTEHRRRLGRMAKWSIPLLGIVVVTSLTLGTGSSRPSSAPTSSPAVRSLVAPEASGPPAPPVALEGAGSRGVPVEDLPTAAPDERAPSGPRTVGHPTSSAGDAAPTMDDELEAVDRARASLAGGRAEETLARVEAYRTRYREPHFGDEADALEVQALAVLGRTDEARRKAEQFLSAHPRSLYTQRVRSVAGMKD